MLTAWGRALDDAHILPEYPRPQLVRDQYEMLNGFWDCAFTASPAIPTRFDLKIRVPFSPESVLSGVGRALRPGEYLWYRRVVERPKNWKGRLLVHFGAADQIADVFADRTRVAAHTGGYLPFTADVTRHLTDGRVELIVRVRDFTEKSHYARGKQKTRRGGIWHTAQSGLWQSVWMEPVPEDYVESLWITPHFSERKVAVTAVCGRGLPCRITLGNRLCAGRTGEPILLDASGLEPWTPDRPALHPFMLEVGEDRVTSYFALREIKAAPDGNGAMRLFLNGAPLFLSGLLDQGYWPDGLYTAPGDAAMLHDIETAKALGFNLLRKHVKIEPLRFYHHCDRLGMLVWQDMPNGGGFYNPLVTALPALTGLNLNDARHALFGRGNWRGRRQFRHELEEMVLNLYNAPSIVLWSLFNEGWGQFDAKQAEAAVRALDPTRPVDPAGGWHDPFCGQVRSRHVFCKMYRYKPDRLGRCVALSAFGGRALDLFEHAEGRGRASCRRCDSPAALTRAVARLYEDEILPAARAGLCAAVYRQLTDVEDERDGLMTFDRARVKIDPNVMRGLNLRLRAAPGADRAPREAASPAPEGPDDEAERAQRQKRG